MESITIAPSERKGLIIEIKREVKPSRRLRMHIALLASDGRFPTEIARVLFCSRTNVYAVVSRFALEGRSTFDSRRRGPRPLLSGEANERVERLVEEDSPTSHGWLRSRLSCELIAPQLLRERLVSASRIAARSIVSAFAGGGRALSRPRKAPRSRSKRSMPGLRMSCK